MGESSGSLGTEPEDMLLQEGGDESVHALPVAAALTSTIGAAQPSFA